MNSCCAVVASNEIGSVPFLINNGVNGLVYQSGDLDMLFEKVKYLLDHPEEQLLLGQAAYQTIRMVWNANIAVDRLLQFAEKLLECGEHPRLFEKGPCSIASELKDDWYKDFML
jgi:glycosyltransferase involved in cell wall biosynthesis